jgi:hypothetical protein
MDAPTRVREMATSETIPLRDAVRALRAVIMAAAEGASGQAVKFELGAD